MLKIIASLLLMIVSMNSSADVTTQELLAQCKNKNDPLDLGMCLGYIAGFKSSQQVSNSVAYLMGQGAYNFAINEDFNKSIPNDIKAALKSMSIQSSIEWYGCWGNKSYGQIKAVFIKYAESNPELWHEPATPILMQAMRNSFPQPCKYNE